MNARRISVSLSLTVLAAGAIALAAGCSANVEPTDEHTGDQKQAIWNCDPTQGPCGGHSSVTCGGVTTFTSDHFETLLHAMGCGWRRVVGLNGGTNEWTEAICPPNVSVWDDQCGTPDGSGCWNLCNASRCSVNASQLAAVYSNVDPYYSDYTYRTSLVCNGSANYMTWDPTCGSAGCGFTPNY